MNALVGEKLAIITSKAQTTRHRIMGVVNGNDFQIVYSDTPGIIEKPSYKLQESMMDFVRSSLRDADVLLIVTEYNEKEIDSFWHKVKDIPVPKIFIINKIDKAKNNEDVFNKLKYWKDNGIVADEYIPVSALENFNIETVFNSILKYLPEHPPYFDKNVLTDKAMRFFVTEIIREKILLNYKQEIPYSVEVVVDTYEEEDNVDKILAIIYCNRASQKPILIGRQGIMMKKVGTAARLDIEDFTGKKCYLELLVKVRENWRTDDNFLKRFGYKE
ncbi:UNVERIFIED_CONTAM: hypothetical protein GTU68_049495 [Idotea baltica]|nr:hypothetical protein [Idotea baltica]